MNNSFKLAIFDKQSSIKIIFLSLMLTLVLFFHFSIANFQDQVYNQNYQQIDSPDYILESIGHNTIINNTLSENSIFLKINSSLSTTNTIYNLFNSSNLILKSVPGMKTLSLTKTQIYLFLAVKSQGLFKDVNRKEPVSQINIIVLDDQEFLRTSRNLNYYSGQFYDTNYILLINSLNPQYLSLNQTLNIMGENKNQSLIINSPFLINYANPILKESFPYYLKSNYFSGSSLIFSKSNFLKLLANISTLPIFDLYLEYKFSIDFKKSNVSLNDIQKDLNLSYIQGDVFKDSDSFIRQLRPSFFTMNFIQFKENLIKDDSEKILYFLYIIWLFFILMIFSQIKTEYISFRNNSKLKNLLDNLNLNGANKKNILQILIFKLFYSVSMGILMTIFVLKEINILTHNSFNLNIIHVLNIYLVSFIFQFLFYLLLEVVHQIHLYSETHSNNLFYTKDEIKFNLKNLKSPLITIILIIPSLYFLIIHSINMNSTAKILIVHNINPFNIIIVGLFGIIIIFTFLWYKQLLNFILILSAIIISKIQISTSYIYFIKSIFRKIISEKNKSLSLVSIISVILIFSSIFIIQNQRNYYLITENNFTGADIKIHTDLGSLSDINSQTSLLQGIFSNKTDISPFLSFKEKIILNSNYGLESNINIIAINFTHLNNLISYSNYFFEKFVNSKINNNSSIYVSTTFINQFHINNQEKIQIKMLNGDSFNSKSLEFKMIGNYVNNPFFNNSIPSILIDFSSLYHLISTHLISIQDIVDQGYLIWFKSSNSYNKLLIDKINRWDYELSPKFTGKLNDSDSYKIKYLEETILLIIIILIIFSIPSFMLISNNFLNLFRKIFISMKFMSFSNREFYFVTSVIIGLFWLVNLILCFNVAFLSTSILYTIFTPGISYFSTNLSFELFVKIIFISLIFLIINLFYQIIWIKFNIYGKLIENN